MKDFDVYSFKGSNKHKSANKSESSEASCPNRQPWRDMVYRFEANNNRLDSQKQRSFQVGLNKKILNIEEELSENIRRRLELQQKLKRQNNIDGIRVKHLQRSEQKAPKQRKTVPAYMKNENEIANMFANLEIQKQTIEAALKTKKKTKQVKKKLLGGGNQVKIQELIKKLTFPETPKINLEKARIECMEWYGECEHSDIVYLLMVVYYHLGMFQKTRNYYREILTFRVFQIKAHWIACQTEYQLENYDLCLKLAYKCMKELSDRNLERFLYLQCKCYSAQENFTSSLICYNQLIKIKSNLPQLYLERGILYQKIGYPEQAKEDYLQFGVLKPEAQNWLKEQILQQKSQRKRKQLIKALAKIT